MATEADSNPTSQAPTGKEDAPVRGSAPRGAGNDRTPGEDRSGMPGWFVEAEDSEQEDVSRGTPPVREEPAVAEPNPARGDATAPVDEMEAGHPSGDALSSDLEVGMEAEPAELEEAAESEVELWRRKAEENRGKWIRAMAEMENFRKRSRREIQSSINFANANLLRELLEVLDNFERAQGAASIGEEGSTEAYMEGIRLIYQRFVDVLRQSGLERIPAKGEVFDPNLHEAVSQIETDEVESGQIAHVVQEGYRLKDMVLRPARVVVAK